MARTPAFAPDPWTLMQHVLADVDRGGRAERCLHAMHRSGRLKRYSRRVNAWMDHRAAFSQSLALAPCFIINSPVEVAA